MLCASKFLRRRSIKSTRFISNSEGRPLTIAFVCEASLTALHRAQRKHVSMFARNSSIDSQSQCTVTSLNASATRLKMENQKSQTHQKLFSTCCPRTTQTLHALTHWARSGPVSQPTLEKTSWSVPSALYFFAQAKGDSRGRLEGWRAPHEEELVSESNFACCSVRTPLDTEQMKSSRPGQ